jgi:palmitoyltransferase
MKGLLRAWGWGEYAVSLAVRGLGVLLVLLASALIATISIAYLGVVAPLQASAWRRAVHFAWFGWCMLNCVFNYAMTIVTDAGSPKTEEYRRLIEELRPPNDDVETGTLLGGGGLVGGEPASGARMRRGAARAEGSDDDEDAWREHVDVYGWLKNRPYEWGLCTHTMLVKPPRSHYDHITRQLVLSMDHFCPWVCNCVGYLNYRYFCLFVFWTWLGCITIVLNAAPAMHLLAPLRQHADSLAATRALVTALAPSGALPSSMVRLTHGERGALRAWAAWTPFGARDARLLLSNAKMLAFAVGISLTFFSVFHLILVLTGQTTIEFWGNWAAWMSSRAKGQVWKGRPFDEGLTANWRRVFGSRNPILAVAIPSCRRPPFPPFPWPPPLAFR